MIIPWLILSAFLIMFIQTLIYSKWVLFRIQYSRFFSHDAVFEGEQIEMVEQISNKKFLPVPWLRLESNISANLQFQKQFNLDVASNQFHRSLFSLTPYQKITRRHKVTCTKRGDYQLETVSVTAGDPFGFLNSNHILNVSARVLVYPKFVPIEEIPLPSHSWLGDIVVRRWIIEDPFVVAGVREYAPGDPMNAVNWKATARTGALQVSKKDYTADHHLMIYLNFDLKEDIWVSIQDKERIEKGISYAASIAQYAISEGIRTGFGCNSYLVGETNRMKESVRVEPENSQNHLIYILETLARLKMDRSMIFNLFLKKDIDRQMENTDILLITSFVSEGMQESIRQLEAQGNAVEILWLGQENQTGTDIEGTEEGESYAG